MRIRKLDGGGLMTPRYYIEKPARTGSSLTSSKKSSNNSSGSDNDTSTKGIGILSKEMVTTILNKGMLTNDFDDMASKLDQIGSLSNFDNTKSAMVALKMLVEGRNMKEMFEKSVDVAKDKGGFGEVAVASNGDMFVMDGNKVKRMSVDEYKSQRNSVSPLTVSQLMYQRQMNPTMSWDTSAFEAADNAIGLDKINEKIHSLISYLGTESSEDEKFEQPEAMQKKIADIMGSRPTKNELKGLQAFVQRNNNAMNAPSDWVEVTNKTETNRKYMSQAFDYIMQTLGTDARNKLNAQAAVTGTTTKDIISNMLVSQTSESQSQTMKPYRNSELGDAASLEYDKAKEQQSKALELQLDMAKQQNNKSQALSYAQAAFSGALYQPGQTYALNNNGVMMNVSATYKGILPDLNHDGGSLSPQIISTIFSKGNYNSLVDTSNVFLGSQKVDPSKFNQLAYTGDNVAVVTLPTLSNGDPDIGRTKSFQNMLRIEEAGWRKDHDDAKWMNFFKRSGFNVNVTNGIVYGQNLKQFLAMPVVTDSDSDLSNNPALIEKPDYKGILDSAFTMNVGKSVKNVKPHSIFSRNAPMGGMIYVALRQNGMQAMSAYTNKLTQQDIYNTQVNNGLIKRDINGGASALNNW